MRRAKSDGGRCRLGCLLLLVGVLAGTTVSAEPTPSIQFLMQEPVSMLDWGVKNIEDHLYRQGDVFTRHEQSLFDPLPTVAVTYNWEQNSIQIALGLKASAQAQKTSQAIADMRLHVQWILQYLRGSLTMKPYDAFFRHQGFRNKESPAELEVELAGRTELFVTVRDQSANILTRCWGKLVGSQVTWLNIGEP